MAWTSEDPERYGAGDSNLYRYVHNRPTVATDPSGKELVTSCDHCARKFIKNWTRLEIDNIDKGGKRFPALEVVKQENGLFRIDLRARRFGNSLSDAKLRLQHIIRDQIGDKAIKTALNAVLDWNDLEFEYTRESRFTKLKFSNPRDAAVRPKAFWQYEAKLWIKDYRKKITFGQTGLDAAIIRNRYITAAYAQAYSEFPEKFPWLGLAALASEEVGNAMRNIRSAYRELVPRPLRSLGQIAESAVPALYQTGTLLGAGNKAVYEDIFWQFLAYRGGGIKQMRWLEKRGELPKGLLTAWEDIDSGVKNRIWRGNELLFKYEQEKILQPVTFNKLPTLTARQAAKMSTPLFPGNTPFGKVGDNVANFRQRWKIWIKKNLWPEWRKYSTAGHFTLKNKIHILTNPNRP